MTLTDFLLARLAEDEVAATEARTSQDYMQPGAWDLDRVMADVEAKRKVVDLHGVDCFAPLEPGDEDAYFCEGCHAGTEPHPDDVRCPTLAALAQPYADHPDYREEWRA